MRGRLRPVTSGACGGGELCGLLAGAPEGRGPTEGALCAAWAAGRRTSVPKTVFSLPVAAPANALPPRAKYAVSSIKKKVNDKNPHVALYALEVTRAPTPTLPWVPLPSGQDDTAEGPRGLARSPAHSQQRQ